MQDDRQATIATTEALPLEDAARTEHYLLTCWGGVDLNKEGPFANDEARDAAAFAFFEEEGDDPYDSEHSVHFLDVITKADGLVEILVGGYSGGFFMKDEDAEDEDDEDEETDEED